MFVFRAKKVFFWIYWFWDSYQIWKWRHWVDNWIHELRVGGVMRPETQYWESFACRWCSKNAARWDHLESKRLQRSEWARGMSLGHPKYWGKGGEEGFLMVPGEAMSEEGRVPRQNVERLKRKRCFRKRTIMRFIKCCWEI